MVQEGEAPGAPGRAKGAYFTFLYSSRVMRPSLSESYIWNRTVGSRRGSSQLGKGRRGACVPFSPGSCSEALGQDLDDKALGQKGTQGVQLLSF